MPRLQLLGLLAIFCCSWNLATASAQPAAGQAPDEETRYEGRTIAEWIKDFDEGFVKNQAAIRALAAAGKPAAEEMVKIIKEGRRQSGMAFQTLAKMGEPARVALPTLLEIAADKKAPNPQGWTGGVSIRSLLLSEMRNMPWASAELIPVLIKVAGDADEEEWNRLRAIEALGQMGPAAQPILKEFASDKNNAVRSGATDALVETEVASGSTRAEVYEKTIDANPFDPNVPEYLVRMQGIYNNSTINPVTQRVKAQLRKRLNERPDAEIAFALATIIRNGLANTDLEFAAPSVSYFSQSAREDPAENYSTLADALEIVVNMAPKDSDQAKLCARSLARLRLLQGDWDGLNAALAKAGQPPIPAAARAKLPAPPGSWNNLQEIWLPANEAMTSGDAAIELEIEKDGKGLAGAHVLIKKVLPQQVGARLTGRRSDTLFMATQPMETRPYEPFGYYSPDRDMTRYAVSDASGKIRIENLPAIPIVVEVLIPTSNFTEAGRKWDLLMETAPGEIRPTWIETSSTSGARRGRGQAPPASPGERPPLERVSRTEGPAVVTLKAGETTKYPKIIVRQQLLLNVSEWSSVDPDEFVLWWGAVSGEQSFDHYVVEMILTAPQQSPNYLPSQRAIRSTTVESLDTHWNVGASGVGGQKLRPGNIYMFEVRAVDQDGKVLARLPATRVWVPWTHRKSQPPDHEPGGTTRVPIYDGVGWRSGTQVVGQPRVELPEKIEKYLAAPGRGFELEYVQLGSAWLQCLDGKVDVGRKEMERLVAALPEGNIVRGTARSILKQLDAGQALPMRLDFAADE